MQTSDAMVREFKRSPELVAELVANPIATLEKTNATVKENRPAYWRDKWVYRMVIVALGLVLLVAAVGSIILVLNGKQTPEGLVALGSAAVGALAGLFVPSPSQGVETSEP